jgi:DNA-binding NtrC family response regulator
MRKARVLLVDDDPAVLNLLFEILSSDYDCTPAASGEEAISLVHEREFDLVMSDINLGRVGGVEVVDEVAKRSPETMIVMISGNRDINCAIGLMRVAAFDYITKPFKLDKVLDTARRAVERRKELARNNQSDTLSTSGAAD